MGKMDVKGATVGSEDRRVGKGRGGGTPSMDCGNPNIVMGPWESGRIAEGRVCKGETWLNTWEVGMGEGELTS